MNTQCTKSFMNGGMQDIRNLNEEQYSQVVSQAWPSCSKLAEKENYNKVNTENLSNDQNDFMDIDEDFCNNMEKEHSVNFCLFIFEKLFQIHLFSPPFIIVYFWISLIYLLRCLLFSYFLFFLCFANNEVFSI